MSRAGINKVLDQLHSENLLPDRAHATEMLNRMELIQPWYIRTMVGFGAWLASLFLIGFIVGISVTFDGGYIILGILMIIAGCYLRRTTQTDFLVQISLAVGLSGQTLLAFGVIQILGENNNFEGSLLTGIFISSIIFFVFPDRTLRVLEILFISSSVVALIYYWKLNHLIPFTGPLLAAGMVLLQKNEARWIVSGKANLISPAITGLMLSAFGCLQLSTIYLLPEILGDYEFYPDLWISTLMLGALFFYLGDRVWPPIFAANHTAIGLGYLLMLAVVASAWANPGLLLALIVIIIGTSSGSKTFSYAGIGFLTIYTVLYFYGIETTLLIKSITLITTGITVLLARWLILKLATGGDANA